MHLVSVCAAHIWICAHSVRARGLESVTCRNLLDGYTKLLYDLIECYILLSHFRSSLAASQQKRRLW